MEHKLLQNITEYRNWAWGLSTNEWNEDPNVEAALGLLINHCCWDSVPNEDGELVDVDGDVIHEDTAETVALEDWVNEIEFPTIAVHTFENSWDRIGSINTYICDFVSLSEFSQ